jgi:hypothetical protein
MPTLSLQEYRRGLWLALAGIVVLSFDALLVRMAQSPPADVAFWRGVLIALALALVQWGRQGRLHLGGGEARLPVFEHPGPAYERISPG